MGNVGKTPDPTAGRERGDGPAGRPAAYSSLHEQMGIGRQVTEVFTVGAYRYSKLDDAVAQARPSGR